MSVKDWQLSITTAREIARSGGFDSQQTNIPLPGRDWIKPAFAIYD
jgi:hypothetical protein